MQDIHWTDGGFGYFPFHSGAMWRRAADGPRLPRAADTDRDIEEGDFSALFDWLRQNIWQHGSRFTTSQLIQQATGEDLNSRSLPASTRPLATCNHTRRANPARPVVPALYIRLHADTKHSRKARKRQAYSAFTGPAVGLKLRNLFEDISRSKKY